MEEIYKLLEYSYMMQHKHEYRTKLLHSDGLQEMKIAVLCGSTFGVIEEFLEIFLLYYGIKPVFWIGEYNRFFEEACFPHDELKGFAPDIILLHITNKNVRYNFMAEEIAENASNIEKQRLIQIWESLKEQYHCIIIQNNFEYFLYRMIGNAARIHTNGNIKFIDNLNTFISSYAEKNSNFYINDNHFLSSYVGLKNWNDDRMWSMYKYPMGMSVMPRYALNIANIIKSVLGKNKKTIITDLDNTLWGGEIGECGVENIKLGSETPQGEGFTLLHQYLKYLSKHGVMLNICSKNEYEAGIAGIQSSNSILKEDDFIIKKINWNNKYENIQEIIKELNINEDVVVFIDDSPIECDSVRTMMSEVEVVQVENVKNLLEKMDTLSFFEVTNETKEDESRNQYYKEDLERKEEEKKYHNYDEYLKSLEMVCHIDSIHSKNMDRALQLFNKTNQFNFLTKRYTLEELTELIQKDNIRTFTLDLKDKFGSNGIVSISIIRFENKDVYIDGWIMSCRVFERELEFVMLRLICELCLKHDISTLHGFYRETNKNKKIAYFFSDMGFEKQFCDVENDTTEWVCRDIDGLLRRLRTDNIVIK